MHCLSTINRLIPSMRIESQMKRMKFRANFSWFICHEMCNIVLQGDFRWFIISIQVINHTISSISNQIFDQHTYRPKNFYYTNQKMIDFSPPSISSRTHCPKLIIKMIEMMHQMAPSSLKIHAKLAEFRDLGFCGIHYQSILEWMAVKDSQVVANSTNICWDDKTK